MGAAAYGCFGGRGEREREEKEGEKRDFFFLRGRRQRKKKLGKPFLFPVAYLGRLALALRLNRLGGLHLDSLRE